MTKEVLNPRLLEEAVASSLIEGEKVSAAAVRAFGRGEYPGGYPRDDLRRCLNLYYAMRDLLASPGTRLALDCHRRLFAGVEIPPESSLVPGKIRTQAVYIDRGTKTIVNGKGEMVHFRDLLPMMDHTKIKGALRDWSARIRELPEGPVTAYRAGVTHQEFEKIHPFIDGNGRVGRMIMFRQLGYGLSAAILEERYDYYRSLNSGHECGEFIARLARERTSPA